MTLIDVLFLYQMAKYIFGAATLILETVLDKAGVFESPVKVSRFDS